MGGKGDRKQSAGRQAATAVGPTTTASLDHENRLQMHSNLKNEDVSTKRRRIARLAEQSPELGFTSLNHLIDIDWLKEAFRLTRKSRAPGDTDSRISQCLPQHVAIGSRRFHRHHQFPPTFQFYQQPHELPNLLGVLTAFHSASHATGR